MYFDGIRIAEGAELNNLVVPVGDELPPSPAEGELFYATGLGAPTEGVYLFNGTAWAFVTFSYTPVNISGDTMTGPLTLPADPTNALDAATKQYVDNMAPAAGNIVGPGTIDNALISQSSVTQHQGALAIAESQITDGSILARVGGSETITGAWSFSNPVTVATPTADGHAATKLYVDNLTQGLSAKPAVLCASTVALSATYYNGINNDGIGATLTATANGVLTLDTISPAVASDVLIKNQVAGLQNGVYAVTDAGSVSTPWILTRRVTEDESSEISSSYVFVQDGSQEGSGWVMIVANPSTFTIGTDTITVTQFSGSGAPLFTSSLPGIVPQSGGGTSNFLRADGTWVAPAGTGTVTSVGLSLPAIFSVTNSPVTTTGTLTGSLASQTQNLVFASPNGSSGAPTFRALVAADVPTLNQNTSGTAAGLSATLVATSGGTGQSTYATGDIIYASGVNTLAKLAAGTNTHVLTLSGGVPTWAAASGGGTNLSYTAATRVLASDTGTDATLPLVSSGDAGLAPASGGGTSNFLRADGTWTTPAGGGTPGGSDTQVQYNNGGAFGGSDEFTFAPASNLITIGKEGQSYTIRPADSTSASTVGADLIIKSGKSKDNAAAGTLSLIGGAVDGTATADGGDIVLTGGNGYSGGYGGDIQITSGTGGGTGDGGAISIIAGDGGDAGGSIEIRAGISSWTNTNGGDLTLRVGAGGATAVDGRLMLVAGDGTTRRATQFPNGNWNIGPTTTDPSVKLRVEGTFAATDGTGTSTLSHSSGNATFGPTSNHSLSLRTNNTSRVTISATGSVDFGYRHTELRSDITSTSTTTIDCNVSNFFNITMAASITTLTISNVPSSGRAYSMTLFLNQNGSGPWTITWPGAVKWPGATAPTLSGINKTDVITLITHDGGTNWYGFVGGLNF